MTSDSHGTERGEIDRCPFCNSDNLRVCSFDRGANEGNYEYECVVECNKCGSNGPFALHTNEGESKRRAINLWNNRGTQTDDFIKSNHT